MATPYVIVSDTGDISGGLKMEIDQDSWRVWTVDAELFTGLAGDTTSSIGGVTSKMRWSFIAFVRKVGLTGYVSLGKPRDTASQTVGRWSTTTTASQRLKKFTDIYGDNYDVAWKSGFNAAAQTGGINGDAERYAVQVILWER